MRSNVVFPWMTWTIRRTSYEWHVWDSKYVDVQVNFCNSWISRNQKQKIPWLNTVNFNSFAVDTHSFIHCTDHPGSLRALSIDKSAKCYYDVHLGNDIDIGARVSIGKNVTIRSSVDLLAGVQIASNVRIGQGTRVYKFACIERNTKITEGSRIEAYARVFPKLNNRDVHDFELPPRGYKFILKNDKCEKVKR